MTTKAKPDFFDVAKQAGFVIVNHPSFGRCVYIKKGALKMNVTQELLNFVMLEQRIRNEAEENVSSLQDGEATDGVRVEG